MKKRHFILWISILLLILVNVLAWNNTAFCDYYVANVFPVITKGYGQFTSIFTFSVGEIMIAIAAVLMLVAILLGIFAVIFLFVKRRSNSKYLSFVKAYYRFLGRTAIVVGFE